MDPGQALTPAGVGGAPSRGQRSAAGTASGASSSRLPTSCSSVVSESSPVAYQRSSVSGANGVGPAGCRPDPAGSPSVRTRDEQHLPRIAGEQFDRGLCLVEGQAVGDQPVEVDAP